MRDGRAIERLWFANDPAAVAARLALAPLELAYAAVVAARGAMYERGMLASHESALAAVSVGNLTVGGTGKTPFAAWLAARIAEAGAHPALVLRGYADGVDEPLVHRVLNPEVPVIIAADRIAGVARARAAGADVAVLDDAFQHRRIARAADVVLVSADRWTAGRRMLPAGPWREPVGALRRASLAVIVRKARSSEDAELVGAELARRVPRVERAVVHLALGPLRRLGSGEGRRLATLAGEPVLAISAVGDPAAFAAQLAQHGALVHARAFPDHHRFTAGEAERLAREADASRTPAVCTLKDAVKLEPLWPRAAAPLWYVSQQIFVESGRPAVDALLATVLDARQSHL